MAVTDAHFALESSHFHRVDVSVLVSLGASHNVRNHCQQPWWSSHKLQLKTTGLESSDLKTLIATEQRRATLLELLWRPVHA